MRTMRLESPTGVTGTCGYEAYRGRLYLVLARNGERLTCEIPLGEMASRCQLSGKVIDGARARWEAANLDVRAERPVGVAPRLPIEVEKVAIKPKPAPKPQRQCAARLDKEAERRSRHRAKEREWARKHKTKLHGVRSLMREPAEPVEDAAVLVTAAPKLDFPEAE